MNLTSLFLGLTLSLFSFSSLAFNQSHYFHQQSLLMQSQKSSALNLRFDGSFRVMEKGFYDQKLKSSDLSDQTTFKQRFFIDSKYAKDQSSPVFYIICGEWNCAGTGSYTFVEAMAKKMQAHLVALEHRYYGESVPFADLTTENLKYLDLDSAIEDLARFQRHMMEDRGFNGKWISFGGSYAGTLSAFYRLKHPELVVGSLASSAPVFTKAEFNEYDAHIAQVINKSSCGDKVREAVALIEKKLETPEGAEATKKLFDSSDIKETGDFLYVVADMLAAAVQYGRDKAFCDTLNTNEDLVVGYAKAGIATLTAMGSRPIEISMQAAEKINVTPDENFRQWMWQSCKEFGWFQVANGTGATSSRSSTIDLVYHENVCKRLFQVPMTADGSLNQDWYFPIFNPSTTHIMFTNGGNDPWLRLSVVPGGENTNEALNLFMMDGAAHCNDLRATIQIPAVIAAQVTIENLLQKWITE